MFRFCDPTENTSNRNLKNVFPLTEAYGTRIQQAPHANPSNCSSAPPLVGGAGQHSTTIVTRLPISIRRGRRERGTGRVVPMCSIRVEPGSHSFRDSSRRNVANKGSVRSLINASRSLPHAGTASKHQETTVLQYYPTFMLHYSAVKNICGRMRTPN